jgi:hypothetical protein
VYSLKNKFNFSVLSARYTLDPFISYEPLSAGTDTKLVVIAVTLKNISPQDNFWDRADLFTLVDSTGQLYPTGNVALRSVGAEAGNFTLRPGQGMGQVELKDPLEVGCVVPAKARIVKIMLNTAPLNSKDEVIRYFVAGSTKEEAGQAGDPKNIIAPLPETVREGMGPAAAIAVPEGKGVQGTAVPSGFFSLKLDGFGTTAAKIGDTEAEDGKTFVIATVTAKGLTPKRGYTMFEITGGDFPLHELVDTDGEKYKPFKYLKAKRDEDAEHEFMLGEEYSFRIVFQVPKDAKFKKLVLGAGSARKWAYDAAMLKPAP